MKKLYIAGNIQEVQLISDLLNDQGIYHIVKNRDLQSILGELPVQETLPSIWVKEDDFQEAKDLLDQINKPEIKGCVWTCSCGEVLEPQFNTCWRCGKDKK